MRNGSHLRGWGPKTTPRARSRRKSRASREAARSSSKSWLAPDSPTPPAPVREHPPRLALALESLPEADVEALVVHLLGAGEGKRAALYAERAAEQAVRKVAFDRAVRLYRLTLETVAPSSEDARRLRT